MKLVVKAFGELPARERLALFTARTAVFIVEQNCPYQDIDGWDECALHVFYEDGGNVQAYLRVLPPHTVFDLPSLGRILTVRRGCGLGAAIVKEGLRVIAERYGDAPVKVKAQLYAAGFYEKLGFVPCSAEFPEDGIPHIEMIRVPGVSDNTEKKTNELT